MLTLQQSAGNAAVVRALANQRQARMPLRTEETGAAGAAPAVQRAKNIYHQTKPTGIQDEPGELRMLDRFSRLQDGSDGRTPHVAAASMPDGKIGLAANTGNKAITEEEAEAGNIRMREIINLEKPLPEGLGARQTKDAKKVRAALSGKYAKGRTDANRINETMEALNRGIDWKLVAEGGAGAQHGELTLLEEAVEKWKENPNAEGPVKEFTIGGRKKPCACCTWAFEAANNFIAGPLRYKVVYTATHGSIYPGWIMPEFLRTNADSKNYIENLAANEGGSFMENRDGYYQLHLPEGKIESGAKEALSESESEWSSEEG